MTILAILGFMALMGLGLYLAFIAVVIFVGEYTFGCTSPLSLIIGAMAALLIGIAIYLTPFTITFGIAQ